MTAVEQFLEVFSSSIKVGETFTKRELYQNVIRSIPSLRQATAGWILHSWLKNKGRIARVGEGEEGYIVYRRIN